MIRAALGPMCLLCSASKKKNPFGKTLERQFTVIFFFDSINSGPVDQDASATGGGPVVGATVAL
jgi:hypothetical protein